VNIKYPFGRGDNFTTGKRTQGKRRSAEIQNSNWEEWGSENELGRSTFLLSGFPSFVKRENDFSSLCAAILLKSENGEKIELSKRRKEKEGGKREPDLKK